MFLDSLVFGRKLCLARLFCESPRKVCSFDGQSSLFVYEMLDRFPHEPSVINVQDKQHWKVVASIVHGQEDLSLQPKIPSFKTILNVLIILDPQPRCGGACHHTQQETQRQAFQPRAS